MVVFFLADFSLGLGLLGLAWVDERRRRIPNRVLLGLLFLGLGFLVLGQKTLGPQGDWNRIFFWEHLAAGLGIFLGGSLFCFLFPGRLGMGDVKLLALLCFYLGYVESLLLFCWALFLTLARALFLWAWRWLKDRRAPAKKRPPLVLPLAPQLALAFFCRVLPFWLAVWRTGGWQ